MSSTLQAHSGVDTQKLRSELHSEPSLTHVTPPQEGLTELKHSVIEAAASEGRAPHHHLRHVDAPNENLNEKVVDAYLKDRADEDKEKRTKL